MGATPLSSFNRFHSKALQLPVNNSPEYMEHLSNLSSYIIKFLNAIDVHKNLQLTSSVSLFVTTPLSVFRSDSKYLTCLIVWVSDIRPTLIQVG